MTASVLKLAAANTVNLTKVKDGPAKLMGVELLNTTAAAIYIKFYFHQPTEAVPAPVVGTTVPDMTIQIPALGTTTGSDGRDWANGITKPGNLYFALTNLPADNDATVVAAGSGLVSILFE